MTSVKDVLDEKGREIFSTSPDASVYEALKLMAENNIASLVVVEDGIPSTLQNNSRPLSLSSVILTSE